MFWRSDFVLVLCVSSYKKARVITQHCICGFWTRILEHFWSRLGKDRWCPAAFFASALLFWLLQAKYWRGRRLDQEVFKTGMVGEHLERRCFVCVRVCVWGSISELFTIACIDSRNPLFSPGNQLTMSNGDVREKTKPEIFCWCPEPQRYNRHH